MPTLLRRATVTSTGRTLRARGSLVAVGGVLAGFIGLSAGHQITGMPPRPAGSPPRSSIVTARVLLSARSEPAVDIRSTLTDTLGIRAVLTADVLSTDASRARIARGAHLKPADIAVFGPATGTPPLELPLALDATSAASMIREPYSLSMTADASIPIITLKATGPYGAGATRIVNAATTALDQLLASKSAHGPALFVQRLGPPIQQTRVAGPRIAVAVAAGTMVFGLWCIGLYLVAVARRRARPA